MLSAIVGATVIDGTGRAPLSDAVVLVEGGRISEVGRRGEVPIPPGTQQIDARGKYLLPGMIELHSHMFHPSMVQGAVTKESPAYAALYAANNLRQALQAGVTAVRDMAAMDYVDVTMKRAVAEGIILGPRLFVSGRGICMTGGHGSQLEGFMRIANGVDEVRTAVREQVMSGADLIKLLTTHRSHTPEFTQEELNAGADEAHRLGRRVACHAAALPGTRQAAIAGVDTIEHGTFLEDETLVMMVDKGITLVPTCYAVITLLEWARTKISDPSLPHLVRKQGELMVRWLVECAAELPKTLERALKKGVAIGTGTDVIARAQPYAALPDEIEMLTKYGCTPMQAIESATRVSALALGQEDSLGTVEKGKYADLIMVDRDPLEDVRVLKEVSWVMKGGATVPFSPEYGRLVGMAPWARDEGERRP